MTVLGRGFWMTPGSPQAPSEQPIGPAPAETGPSGFEVLTGETGPPWEGRLEEVTHTYVMVFEGEDFPVIVDRHHESEQFFPTIDLVAPTVEMVCHTNDRREISGSVLLRHKDHPYESIPLRAVSKQMGTGHQVTLTGYGSAYLLKAMQPNEKAPRGPLE